VESSFNPFAESQLGAQGLMQVMPRFHMDKIGSEAGADALFDPQLNIKVGTEILRDGLRRFGDLEAALQYYGGALDDPAAAYAQKVLSIKDRLAGAARRAGTSSAGV
jgi:soluble lytic murein transglycosylase-like protein